MPQLLLPGFPAGATTLNETISLSIQDGHYLWHMGELELFRHTQKDRASYKTIISALMHSGLVRPCEFERSPLKLNHRTLMNWSSQYQTHGASSFYRTQRSQPAEKVMTAANLRVCQSLLDAGQAPAEVARKAGIKDSTLRKAIARGDLSKPPIVVVSKSVTEGLAATLLEEILPDLLQCVPGQPTEQELAADPTLHRFVMVFDREGATHDLLSKLWEHRVAAITYRKAVKDIWPDSEFKETEVVIPGAGSSTMLLATRQSTLSASKASIPVIEVRKLCKQGHQTAVISTARQLSAPVVAGRMFARWCQENFFAYMMQHFDIDGLVQYGAQELPSTVQVVNPLWRVADQQVRQTRRKLQTMEMQAGQLAMDQGVDLLKRADLHPQIEQVETELDELRQKRRTIPRKIAIGELPEAQRPNQLPPLRKALVDTVKMIAYRAETALVGLLRRHLNKPEDGRALIRELFTASADIVPDPEAETLTIRIHRMACSAHDKAIGSLLTELTAAQYQHPQTQARMIFEMA